MDTPFKVANVLMVLLVSSRSFRFIFNSFRDSVFRFLSYSFILSQLVSLSYASDGNDLVIYSLYLHFILYFWPRLQNLVGWLKHIQNMSPTYYFIFRTFIIFLLLSYFMCFLFVWFSFSRAFLFVVTFSFNFSYVIALGFFSAFLTHALRCSLSIKLDRKMLAAALNTYTHTQVFLVVIRVCVWSIKLEEKPNESECDISREASWRRLF